MWGCTRRSCAHSSDNSVIMGDVLPSERQSMSTEARTDVHRPSALVTEDYEFAFCGMHHAPAVHTTGPANMETLNELLAEGYRFADVHGAEQCSHCGTRINYYAVLRHLPSKTLIHVGETCLDNRFELASEEFHELRLRAALDRAAQRVKGLRESFRRRHPDLYDFLEENAEGRDEFYGSLWRYLSRHGELSPAQIKALQASIERKAVREAERAEKAASEPAPAPVVEGRITVTGEVLSTKAQDSPYGPTLKMLVLEERGFKVWGTLPRALEADVPLVGKRVVFTASVERSDDDECFGFFKRPAQARVVA